MLRGYGMCEIYTNSDSALYDVKTRSIRIDGLVTSIRLELVFWKLLERISYEEGLKLSDFLSKIYYEKLMKCGKIENFTSFLRVACTTYLNNKEHVKIDPEYYKTEVEI